MIRTLSLRLLLPTLLGMLLVGCAHNSAQKPLDPLEPVNRKIYAFNMTADRWVLRPVAVGYTKVVPTPVRTGVSNFIDNFFYPRVILHDLLQGKFKQGGKDLARFTINTLGGFGGFVDVAYHNVGLEKNDEDLGQTLGVWGVGEGWYLMLPLLGPSTNRGLVGRIGDNWTDPTEYMDGLTTQDRLAIAAGVAIDGRSSLLDADSILAEQLDPYVFVRSVYLQNLASKVRDGKVAEDEFDYGFELPEE